MNISIHSYNLNMAFDVSFRRYKTRCRQTRSSVLRTSTSLGMKSTVALFVTLAMTIAAVSGLAVDPQNKRDGVFLNYPTLAPEAAPTKEARQEGIFNIYPSLAPEAAPTKEARQEGIFNIYPSLAPEAAPTKEARQINIFNTYPTLAPEEGPKTLA
ncbi:hypothetical protein C8F01DRAFT_616116 [Mycena amicta]|nr:hypothetical protein C8F01DRAFT_616116 [Mycena amicta]